MGAQCTDRLFNVQSVTSSMPIPSGKQRAILRFQCKGKLTEIKTGYLISIPKRSLDILAYINLLY